MRILSAGLQAARPQNVAHLFAASQPSSSYGRTAAYRRISTAIGTTSRLSSHPSRLSPSSTQLAPSTPFLRSRLQPQDVLRLSTQIRHISFKEMREARQKEQQQQAAQTKAPRGPTVDNVEDKEPRGSTTTQEDPSESAAERAYREAAGESFTGEKKAEEGEATGEEGEKKEEKKDAPPPPKYGDKTPWQVFTETLSTEFKASKEWNDSTKQLAAGVNDFTQNETVKRARTAYSAGTDAVLGTTGKVLKSTASTIGQTAAWTWDTPVMKGVRAGANVVGKGIDVATKPVRETKAYKELKSTIDDGSSSRYGGWSEKEERKRRREAREAKEFAQTGGRRPEKMEEDPEAGTNITLHKDARWKQSWQSFRDSSPLMQSLFSVGKTYKESENPLISTARSISDRIAGFFAENETAMVIKKFREMDPTFQIEPFLTEMREYILPEVLDAYVKGDVEVLKLWLSAAQYQVYAALMQQYTTAGLKSDGRILDIRHVDILSARLLEPGEIPVFIVTCRTQEVHVYKNAKSGELAAGMEDKVQQVTYAIGVTRLPEDVGNKETRGWRLIELQKSGRDYI